MPPFDDLIFAGRESTNLEYKRSAPWHELRIAIIRTVLGMANTRDGGHIVVGVVEREESSPYPEGVLREHREGFPSEEDFRAAVNGFAEPFVEPRLEWQEHSEKQFLVIEVPEFSREPVLCTRTEGRLREGALYIRSTRKPETTDIRTVTDMQALVQLIREKALAEWLGEFTRAGGRLLGPLEGQAPTDEFARELGEI